MVISRTMPIANRLILLAWLSVATLSTTSATGSPSCFTETYEENKVLLNCAHTHMRRLNVSGHDAGLKRVVYMLDVSDNEISVVSERALSDFAGLNILILSRNRLNDTRALHFGLRSLARLQVLDLSFNKLEHLSWGFLQNVPGLKILDVSNNLIGAISPPPAPEKVALEKLLISHNPLRCIENVPIGVRDLDLSGTEATPQELTRLSAFNNLVYLKLDRMPNLNETLKRTFGELENLEEVSFRSCRNLVRLDEDTFSRGNRKLRWVDLSHCALTTLPKKLEPVLLRLQWLDLRGNPWSCDRRIHWMWRLHLAPALTVPEFRCVNPPGLRNMGSSNFLATRVHLHSVHSKMLAGVWLTILIGAAAVAVYMIKRRLNRIKLNVDTAKYSVRHYSRLNESSDNVY
ncbi:unnamed protein product [Bemisia tabaci]|uniref:Uncharacterized protein n=1 Tax=Bemisia tabaci TaxID=7038 RepID=A0A9P0ANT0_BEMTA|nr:unnamed protein product [Bemisia tabaci]